MRISKPGVRHSSVVRRQTGVAPRLAVLRLQGSRHEAEVHRQREANSGQADKLAQRTQLGSIAPGLDAGLEETRSIEQCLANALVANVDGAIDAVHTDRQLDVSASTKVAMAFVLMFIAFTAGD